MKKHVILQGKWLIVLTLIVVAIIFNELIIRPRKENYTMLWKRVNSLWANYCSDKDTSECRPSIGEQCQCGD